MWNKLRYFRHVLRHKVYDNGIICAPIMLMLTVITGLALQYALFFAYVALADFYRQLRHPAMRATFVVVLMATVPCAIWGSLTPTGGEIILGLWSWAYFIWQLCNKIMLAGLVILLVLWADSEEELAAFYAKQAAVAAANSPQSETVYQPTSLPETVLERDSYPGRVLGHA